jgi:hypothetical protein
MTSNYLVEVDSDKISNISVVSLVNRSNTLKINKKYLDLTNVYSNSILIDKQFILKGCGESIIKNSEIELLKKAKTKNFNNLIVEIIADYIGVFDIDNRIVLEMSSCTMQDYFFEPLSYKLKKKNFISLNEYKGFLEYMACNFFKEILNFLIKENIVYCDWKFDNILVFASNNNDDKCIYGDIKNIKLTDFGSVLKNRLKIKNINNINIYFSSPYLSKIFEHITPTHFDDCKAVSYLLYKLNGKNLPWQNISLNIVDKKISKETMRQSYIEITHQKIDRNIYYLKTDDLLYWPICSNKTVKTNKYLDEYEIFSCLNLDYWE